MGGEEPTMPEQKEEEKQSSAAGEREEEEEEVGGGDDREEHQQERRAPGGDQGRRERRSKRKEDTMELQKRVDEDFIKQNKLRKPSSTLRSIWWTASFIYVNPGEKELFYCLECKQSFKLSGSSTALRRHIESKHKNTFTNLVAQQEAEAAEGGGERTTGGGGGGGVGGGGGGLLVPTTKTDSSSKQPFYFQSTLQLPYQGERLFRIHRALAGFLIRDMRPFNLIEGEGFRAFLNTICPQYQVSICNNVKNNASCIPAQQPHITLK